MTRFLSLLRHPRTLDVLAVLAAAVAIKLFIGNTTPHYPIQHWLFWRYALAWSVSVTWAVSVIVMGHRLLKVVRRGAVLPIREHLVMSAAVGVLAFFLTLFLGGALQLYGPLWFVALPLAFLAAGARPAFRYLRRLTRLVRARRRRGISAGSPWARPLVAFGLFSLLAVYLPILLPENVSYDARWYHVAIGEQYAATGGIHAYREGWLLGSYPHLASYLYAWAFQLPGAALFDRIELAAHLELMLLFGTVAGIPPLVRSLVPGVRASHAWTALFLFPGILIYDSSLNCGADHVAAFWAIPIYLTLLRAWRVFSPVNAGLFAAMVAGALNTKYSAIAIVAGPLVAFAMRAVLAAFPRNTSTGRTTPWPALLAAATALAAALLLTAPHWGKNWVFYGDPVYPLLRGHLSAHPWSAEAARQFESLQTAAWRAPRTMEGLKESIKVLGTFSFVPHDWPSMHGTTPVFGSLFTVTVVLLPLVWRARIWGIYLSTHLCVFAWFWVQHEDRYLQGLAPVMAASVAAVVAFIWTTRGLLARAAVSALVGLQVVWGGDIFSFPAHSMLGGSPFRAVLDHLSSGFRKEYKQRTDAYPSWVAVRERLQRHDVLLIHEEHMQLGVGVHTVQDFAGFQGGLYYTDSRSPADLLRKLRDYGATHVLWRDASQQRSTIAEDLLFFDFAARYTTDRQKVSGFNLTKLPEKISDERPFGDVVAFYGCRATDDFAYAPGLYHLRQLNITPFERRPAARLPRPFEPASGESSLEQHLERADFVVINRACHSSAKRDLKAGFVSIGSLRQLEFWVRKTSP